MATELGTLTRPQFRDEHRQALDWLNENTRQDQAFFGVETQLEHRA